MILAGVDDCDRAGHFSSSFVGGGLGRQKCRYVTMMVIVLVMVTAIVVYEATRRGKSNVLVIRVKSVFF